MSYSKFRKLEQLVDRPFAFRTWAINKNGSGKLRQMNKVVIKSKDYLSNYIGQSKHSKIISQNVGYEKELK